MRVIGGEFRSRALKSVPGTAIRPTPDRLREALFNVLTHRIEGAVFADLYAGTGAVAIEALSRGAAKAILIEQNRTAIQVIRENLRSLGIEDRALVRQGRAVAAFGGLSADIVFVDPPYEPSSEYETVLQRLGEAPPPLVIVQHSVRLELLKQYGKLSRKRVIKQGDNILTFYRRD